MLRVRLSPFWFEPSPVGLHEAVEGHCGLIKKKKLPPRHLHGRHSRYWVIRAGDEGCFRSSHGPFDDLGFIISAENSVLNPAQSLEYIGLVIDTLLMTFTQFEKKRVGLVRLCREALSAKKMSLSAVARIIGTMNWAVTAVKYAKAFFRSSQTLYIMELQRSVRSLDADAVLSDDARDDLRWWLMRAKF